MGPGNPGGPGSGMICMKEIKWHVNGAGNGDTEKAGSSGKPHTAQDCCSLPSNLIEVIQVSANQRGARRISR